MSPTIEMGRNGEGGEVIRDQIIGSARENGWELTQAYWFGAYIGPSKEACIMTFVNESGEEEVAGIMSKMAGGYLAFGPREFLRGLGIVKKGE